MNKYQHNGYVRGPASETELLRSGTYIITDELSSTQEKVGLLDEVFIAESILTQPARALADDEDDDESGMDIQVIDLEEDDDDKDADEEDEEFDDDEPLDFAEKVGQRDRNRWKLDSASVDPDTRELSEEPAPPES